MKEKTNQLNHNSFTQSAWRFKLGKQEMLGASLRKIIAIIFFVVVLVISTVFALNNDQATVVNYLFGSTELPLSLIVFWAGLCGLLLGVLGMLLAVYKYRYQLSRTKKQLAKADKELQHLRQQSIAGKDPF